MTTYAPSTLNEPADVITYVAIAPCMIQITVDTTALLSGDVLNIQVSDNIPGSRIVFINDYCALNTVDPGIKTYPVILAAGDTAWLRLNQTAGTVKTVACEIRVIASE